ncbi:S66 peptidase family protein [Spirosoma montaniterrae]|uniref:LD-carboxypeptidase n=1 Tax=Spirosoma montaniterrae TaxID=1178516 RepID=A0A1P9WUE7_9BACT|nr:LD-carboxypeptidase [Spirosoma montaniterrae]AQG78968.1 LD-carboxypeptidase [Spirosoma montaniterrae]
MLSRRSLLKTAVLAPVIGAFQPPVSTVKPLRLKPGDTVGLACPAAPAYSREQVQVTIESLAALGLKTKLAPHFYDRYGYLAGHDADRAADLNALFADPTVHMVMAMHGGWGCARLLPLLDYDLMRRNPKLLIGYSDITALLLSIYAKTGLATLHGPEGAATWNAYTVDWFRRVLMNGEAVTFQNPAEKSDLLAQTKDRIWTIQSGTARGQLVGGNLTVLCHLVGSPYLPDWRGKLLFIEDVGEDVYSMDRMLTHLKLAGILGQVAGVVFGKCTRCDAGSGGYGSLTLEDVLTEHIGPLNIPAYAGAMIGHIADKFTIPLGINAELDATKGTIRLLESAVL